MLLLKKKSFELSTDAPVVTAEEAAQVASAEAIVSAAEAEAQRIVAEAKVAFEAEKRRGYEEGLDQAESEALDRKLELMLKATDYVCGIENTIGELVVKALRKCVGEIGDTTLVMPIVHKAMEAIVRNQRTVTIRVAPAMVSVVRAKLEALLKDFPSVMRADVVEDAHLTAAACVVETAAGNVEASVDGQIAAIEKSIKRQFSKDGH